MSVADTCGEKGIGVTMVNSNDPAMLPEGRFEVMQERAPALGFQLPWGVDVTSEVDRAFGAGRRMEFYLFFDAQGLLAYTGALDDNAQNPEAVQKRCLAEAAEQTPAGQPVALPATQSIGCSIK